MTSQQTRAGGRHEADLAGAFSPGWDFRHQRRSAISLDGAMWGRAHMSEATRALLVGWLFAEVL